MVEPKIISPEIINKFDLVLDGLSKRDYKVANDVYFEMFISHLSGKSGEGELDFFSDWHDDCFPSLRIFLPITILLQIRSYYVDNDTQSFDQQCYEIADSQWK